MHGVQGRLMESFKGYIRAREDLRQRCVTISCLFNTDMKELSLNNGSCAQRKNSLLKLCRLMSSCVCEICVEHHEMYRECVTQIKRYGDSSNWVRPFCPLMLKCGF